MDTGNKYNLIRVFPVIYSEVPREDDGRDGIRSEEDWHNEMTRMTIPMTELEEPRSISSEASINCYPFSVSPHS